MTSNEFLNLLKDKNIERAALSETLVGLLEQKGLKISTAESCTGGLVSKKITDISGASAVFDCGICSYANSVKEKLLGVQSDTLTKYGAVSDKTALEMAQGIRRIASADIGISTTGIAGPLGGNQYKPVGLVYIGVSTIYADKVFKFTLGDNGKNDREAIRELASDAALYVCIDAVSGLM